jgi:hypothetical protein
LNLDSEFTRKKLTKFLCQELLYEFVTHNLDSAREKEVTDYLATCRDSQRELDNLNKGLRFAMSGAKTKVSPAMLNALENFEPQWKKQMRAWTIWSSQRGWKSLPYVFVAGILILGIAVARPWVSKTDADVTLAEQLKMEPDMLPQAPPQEMPKTPTMEPLVMAQSSAVTVKPESAPYKPDLMETIVKDWVPTLRTLKPSVIIAQGSAAIEAAAERAKVSSKEAEAQNTIATVDEAMGRGYLFRTIMQVPDFQNSWPAIRDKIVALGGKVAGNVELGWLRKGDESYFHFTLPESNMNELEIFLGTFGPVQFSKDRHPRVMPEGQIRIIMSVKDGMTQNEAPAETP